MQVAVDPVRLFAIGKPLGRAHLHTDGIRHILVAFLVDLDAALEDRDALFTGGESVGFESGFGGGYSAINIGF